MLCRLACKNISKSVRDYAVYFLTLVLGVSIFYMFNSLDSQSVASVGWGDFESRGRSTAEISGICSGTNLWSRWRNGFGKFVVPGKRNAAFGGWFLGIA